MNRETSWNLEILNSKGRREDFHYQRGSCDVLSCLEVLCFIEGSCRSILISQIQNFAPLLHLFLLFTFSDLTLITLFLKRDL